ncbi:MAG TPA: glycosyltransferase family 39 protein [Thermoanaerobaculia bacterium]
MNRTAGWFVLLLAGFFALYFSALVLHGYLGLPPVPGDGQDYDNIALQIARGRGVATNSLDLEWRVPYAKYNGSHVYDGILSRRDGYQLTTYRPPLLPFILAGLYRAFGRQFVSWQVLSCLIVALGLALVCLVAKRVAGTPAMALTAVLSIATRSYFSYTGEFGLLTEPLSVGLVGVLLFSIAIMEERPTAGAILCGIDLALLGLARNLFIPLTIAITLPLAFVVRRRSAAVAFLLAIGLQCPWWIRNMHVLHAPMPFGTQSGIAMYGGFSDGAVQHGGVFWSTSLKNVGMAYAPLGITCVNCNEVELARYGWRGAAAWVRAHPVATIVLGWKKVQDTLRSGVDDAGLVVFLYVFGAAAPFVIRRNSAVLAAFGIVVFNLAVIAATWSAGWRYLVPVEPLLAFLTAVTVARVLERRT